MRRITHCCVLLAVVVLGSLSCGVNDSELRLYRVSDGRTVTLEEAMPDLKEARLIFVGESHGEKRHHDVQLEIIRVMKDEGIPVAVGLEMFRKESQHTLDRWVQRALDEPSFEKDYYENWNLPWGLYRDIFVYARNQNIPLVGLNVSREITRQVAEKGFASLTPEQLGELPEVTCRVDAAYLEFMRRALGARGHEGINFIHFCEAQLVWDTAMAWNLLNYLRENPDHSVVVLAGSGHAWKQGIPRQVEDRARIPYRVILPEVLGRTDKSTVAVEDADYLWTK